VPIRLEVGPRDFDNKTVRLVRRDTSDKSDHPFEGIGDLVKDTLEAIQANLFIRSKAERDQKLVKVGC